MTTSNQTPIPGQAPDQDRGQPGGARDSRFFSKYMRENINASTLAKYAHDPRNKEIRDDRVDMAAVHLVSCFSNACKRCKG